MHLCHAEECITSFCFCCSVSDSLSLVQYLSLNLGLTPPAAWELRQVTSSPPWGREGGPWGRRQQYCRPVRSADFDVGAGRVTSTTDARGGTTTEAGSHGAGGGLRLRTPKQSSPAPPTWTEGKRSTKGPHPRFKKLWQTPSLVPRFPCQRGEATPWVGWNERGLSPVPPNTLPCRRGRGFNCRGGVDTAPLARPPPKKKQKGLC